MRTGKRLQQLQDKGNNRIEAYLLMWRHQQAWVEQIAPLWEPLLHAWIGQVAPLWKPLPLYEEKVTLHQHLMK